MYRSLACLLFSCAVLAQTPASSGDQFPKFGPDFARDVERLAQNYQLAEKGVKARAIAERALQETEGLGESNPTRIQLYGTMGNLWWNDQNLLKALAHFERAAATAQAAPGGVRDAKLRRLDLDPAVRTSDVEESITVYLPIALLYELLGRPDDLENLLKKMRAVTPNSAAQYYEIRRKLDDAAAVYTSLAAQRGDPLSRAQAFRGLASIVQRQNRYSNAVAATRQAIAVLEAVPGRPFGDETMELRFELAGQLRQAGQPQSELALYQQLLAETKDRSDIEAFRIRLLEFYAGLLGRDKRAPEGMDLLTEYLEKHPNLPPRQKWSLLSTLSSLARDSGDLKRAEEYKRIGEEQHRLSEPVLPPHVSIDKEVEAFTAAAKAGHLDEALAMVDRAFKIAPRANDSRRLLQISQVADALVAGKLPGPADELYQRLFAAIPAWPDDNVWPLLLAEVDYVGFLWKQRDRWKDIPAAIDRYRNTLISAHGAGTGQMEKVLNMIIQNQNTGEPPEKVAAAAEDLLKLEESMSGPTSAAHLKAVETAASVFETANPKRAIQLRLRAVVLADLLAGPGSDYPAWVRRRSASSLAKLGRFDDAERLAREAVEIARRAHPSDKSQFEDLPDEIRKLKPAP